MEKGFERRKKPVRWLSLNRPIGNLQMYIWNFVIMFQHSLLLMYLALSLLADIGNALPQSAAVLSSQRQIADNLKAIKLLLYL